MFWAKKMAPKDENSDYSLWKPMIWGITTIISVLEKMIDISFTIHVLILIVISYSISLILKGEECGFMSFIAMFIEKWRVILIQAIVRLHTRRRRYQKISSFITSLETQKSPNMSWYLTVMIGFFSIDMNEWLYLGKRDEEEEAEGGQRGGR